MNENASVDLKNLASAVAGGAQPPSYIPENTISEKPVENKVAAPSVAAPVSPPAPANPLMAEVPNAGSSVIITEPPRKSQIPPEAAKLMGLNQNADVSVPTDSPSPVPVPVGLSPDTLATPDVPTVDNGVSQGMSAEEKYNKLLYNDDGTLSDGQRELMAAMMEYVPEREREALARPVFDTVVGEFKTLITMVHLSVTEAQNASYDRVAKQLQDIEESYKKEHPSLGTVIIDKSQDPNGLGLTREEHEKLEKVKKIRLVLMEDAELANIELEHPDEQHKADYIKSIEGTVSKYSVPLPMLGDFASFKGAQIVQMINVVNYDDAKIDENINTKASLIFDKLIGGSILRRYNESGMQVMNYTEFTNKFPYQDIDLALFGILCASSMEESTTSLTCESCAHTWTHRYNLKSLLRMDGMPDYYKQRTEEILANKSNDVALKKLYEARRKVLRYRSPFTNNIYDLSYPSVARAINLLKRVDENDPVMAYNSAIALYINQVLIYNGKSGKYIPVTSEETDLLLTTMQNLINEDMTMLANKIREELFYSAQFVLEVQCPSCQRKSRQELSIDNLIFLKAQDSMVEIE